MNLQIHLQNIVTSASLSGWTCQVIWGFGNQVVAGVSPGTPGQIAETVANTGSNGNCTTSANLYYAGWQLNIKICHQTTACTTSSYAQQEYVAVLALPGGTVPFYAGTQAPTTTWTQPFTVPILPMVGDLAASNTPITMTFRVANGTAIATAKTCYLNVATSATSGGCYFGTGAYQMTFSITLTNTYTTSTFPYSAGYTPFNGALDPLNYNVGQLTTTLQLEDKQTAGSDPIPQITATTGTGFSNGPITKSGSVPDVIYATPDLSGALTVSQQNGFVTISPGSTTIYFNANAAGMTTGSDAATLTFNLYTYYSFSWVSANGGTLNTAQAVTQMSQFVITIQR